MSPLQFETEPIVRSNPELSDNVLNTEILYFDYDNEDDIPIFNSIGNKHPNGTLLRILVNVKGVYDSLDVVKTIPLTDENFESLQLLNRLENLQINNIPFQGRGLQYICENSLKILAIKKCDIQDELFPALSRFQHLEELRLDNWFRTFDAPDLGYLQGCQDLRSCNFTKCYFTDNAFERFPELPSLETLTLEENNITCENFYFVKGLVQLKSLVLIKTQLTTKGIEVISHHAPPKLERLILQYCHAANDDWAALLSMIPGLKELYFNGGHFTDKCITDFQNMQNIEYLSFLSCDISEKACKAIHNACDKATVVLPNGNELESKKQKRIRRRYE